MAEYRSVFDIIGPIMIGPSSSHTAGAVAIGHVANRLFHAPVKKVTVRYYESFAQTHQGHGTDYAIISGVLGFDSADQRVPYAVDLARRSGIEVIFIEDDNPSPIDHPNTAQLTLENDDKSLTVWGCSVGGGTIEIRKVDFNGTEFTPQGPLPLIFVESQQDIEQKIRDIFTTSLRSDPVRIKISDTHFMFKVELVDKPYQEQLSQVEELSLDMITL